MKKTRWMHIIGSLAMAGMALLAIWIFVLSAAPTSAAPVATCPTTLFFSEYIEGSSNNKAIEIYNGTGEEVAMTDYAVVLYANGSTGETARLDLSGVLAAGEVYIIADPDASADILDEADVTSNVALYNGNDALVLYQDGVVVDALGQVGDSTIWGEEVTLVRKSNVMQGDTVEDDAFDPTDEWDEYAQDTFDYLGSHTMDACDATFSISKSAPATVAPNAVFTYTILVKNNTGVTPTTTTITDVVPSGATFIAASDGGAESGGVVSWEATNFADGATITRTFRVTATGTQEIQNAEYGVNGGADWPTTTLGAPVTTQVLADLLIDKSAPATASEGDVFTYTLTITNQLGFTLNDLLITDTVPSNVAVASVLDGGENVNGVISWTVASLAHQAEVSVGFVVTATDLSSPIRNDDYAVSAANYTTPTFGAPVETSSGGLRIYHIQGEGEVSPYLGQTVTVEGIVTADFQATGELEGFFMQDPFGDNNPATSDGIFVYSTQAVNLGDRVEVTGDVAEYKELTEIGSVSDITFISTGNAVAPTEITLPEAVNDEIERYEGMLVTIPHTLTVQQNYFQGRYGQVTLGSGDRMYQPTHLHAPGSAAYWDQVDENARRLLVLDDGSSEQNPDPIPYIGISDTLRAGDVVSTGLTGVLDQGPITNRDAIDYRLHPTQDVTIDRVNVRPATPPDVGGSLRVASFNVLNYFTTFGSRGADTQEEFDRQRTKIISALVALDADVVGLMEIENNGYEANGAIYDLVSGLNAEAGAGTYEFIDPGVAQIGTDEIAVGLLYQPASVTPTGSAAILDDTYDPDYHDEKNRPALAQTFEENGTGERFTAVVNHLKSKGSDCDSLGDPDTGDGQGNCNLTRTRAMTVEVEWLATDPTGSGDPDFIIMGDLNAYAMEDPISVAKNAGYTDLLDAADYSYIFDGESGYLDYALTNDSLTAQVTGAEVWHINADEPSVIDYNTEFKSQDFYAPHVYRASDHDPVLVGLNLAEQTVLTVTKAVTPTADVIVGDTVTYALTLDNGGVITAEGVMLTDTLPGEVAFGGWTMGNNLSATEQDGVITWSGDLPAGVQPGVIAFTATVMAESAAPVTNTVAFASDNAGAGEAEAAFEMTLLSPTLSVAKAVDPTAEVIVGDTVTYTIIVENIGTGVAEGVILTDTLPGEVEFGGWAMGNNLDAVEQNGVVTWTGELADGVQPGVIAFTATVMAESAAPVTNTVAFTSDNAGAGEAEAAFEMTLLSPTLSIAKAVDPTAEVIVGDTVTYTILVENIGTGVAEGIVLTDALPGEIDFGGWAMGHNLDAVEQGGVITWTGELADGVQPGVIAFTATVMAESVQPVTNTVAFTSDNAGAGEAEAAFEMTLLAPELVITKSVAPTADVNVGDTVTYTLTLSNTGSAMATGVVMTDVLPSQLEPGGWVFEGSASIPMTRTLTWGPWDVDAGTDITYIFTATVIAQSDQPVTNTVAFTSENAGAGEAEAAFEMGVPAPELTLNKMVVPTANVKVGDIVTYTITLVNSSMGVSEGVLLTDTLPSEVEFGGWAMGHNLDAVEQGGVITWTGDLPAGVQPGVIAFTATVIAESEQPVINRVDATADNAGAVFATAEFSFASETYIFLPLITKN